MAPNIVPLSHGHIITQFFRTFFYTFEQTSLHNVQSYCCTPKNVFSFSLSPQKELSSTKPRVSPQTFLNDHCSHVHDYHQVSSWCTGFTIFVLNRSCLCLVEQNKYILGKHSLSQSTGRFRLLGENVPHPNIDGCKVSTLSNRT